MTTPSTTANADDAPELEPELLEVVEEDQDAAVQDAVGEAELLDDDADLDAASDGDTFPADTETGSASVVAAGAAAVTAVGFGVTSLGGNWLGSVLAQRQQLLGQIATSNKGTANAQLKAQFTDPWHKTAFVSLGFALVAIVVAGTALFLGGFVARRPAPVWVRALLWGALVLGFAGLAVSAAMLFDLFAGPITVPAGGAS